MRTLVISDIHTRIRWIEPFLSNYKNTKGYDKVVFLGDYFDMFGDGPFEARGTAYWLKNSLQHKDRIHLLGNHDMPYMCPHNDSLWCPGFTPEKFKAIMDVLTESDWNLLRPAVIEQRWLLSHAGASERIFCHPIKGMTAESVVEQAEKALKLIKTGLPQPEFGYGERMISGLVVPQGGITWAHWDSEFWPVEDINQIVGHTSFNKPVSKMGLNSENWCIDTHSQHIGIIEDGKLSFTQEHGVVHKKRGHVIAYHKSYYDAVEGLAEEAILKISPKQG